MGVISFSQDQLQINDSTKFCAEVEVLVATKRMSYMDAVLHLCEKGGMEPEMGATLVNPTIRERIRREATNLNMMPRTATLPF